MRIAVLGAGPCGLAAAWDLSLAGHTVTVIEREPRVGGLAATHRRGGYGFDLGGHRLIATSPRLLARVRDVLGDALLERERTSVIRMGGKTFRYPLELGDVVRNLAPPEAAVAIAGYLAGRLGSRPPDRSFEDWVTGRFGAPLYRRFFGPYTRKLWGMPPSRLAADWAAQRISIPSLGDVIRRLLGRGRGTPRTYARRYLYPRDGMGQLFEAIARRVERAGGRIQTAREPTGFRTARGRITAVEVATVSEAVEEVGEERVVIEADHVISTIPLPRLARLLPDGLDDADARAACSLRFRALRFLCVTLDRRELSPFTWQYVGDPRCIFTRIQEPRQRSPFAAPPGKTSMMLEIPCDAGDAVWTADDAPLLRRALADLRTLGLDVERDVTGVFSTRAEHAYPIYRIGYAAHRDRLLARIGRVPNLTTAGRQGLFRYVFMDAAMAMGFRAAARLDAGSPLGGRDALGYREDGDLLEVKSVA